MDTELFHSEEGVLGEFSEHLTDVGLAGLPDPESGEEGLTFEAWEYIGMTLGKLTRAMQWAIGDWLMYGEHLYGEKYAQASDITGYSYSSLNTYQAVCQRIEPKYRRVALTFAHHQVVAYLEPDDREHWLDFAEQKGWSVQELKANVTSDVTMGARATSQEGHFYELRIRWHVEPDPTENGDIVARIRELVKESNGFITKEITK